MTDISHEPEQEAIHKAVGGALDAWSRVEMALENFFVALLQTDAMAGHIIMASIVSFKARIQVCNNLMANQHVSDEIKTRWTTIYNRLARKYDRRNELAHFSLVYVEGNEGTKKRMVLAPYFSIGNTALHFTRNPLAMPETMFQGSLTSSQINERARGFNDLATELFSFQTALSAERKQRQEVRARSRDPAPAPDTPSARKTKDKPRPPRSSRV